MALYSFQHSVISKTQGDFAGKAAARVRYITRPSAAVAVLAERLDPNDLSPAAVRRFCAERETAAGKTGRIAESFIVALPLEATSDERQTLVRALGDHISKERAPYVAAIHAGSRDAHNPHAHLIVFDIDEARKPGQRGRSRRVIGMSRKGALEEIRAEWASIHNRLMLQWGYGPESFIDHRTLAAQGIERMPTLHEGPRSRAMIAKGQRPRSSVRRTRSGRVIDWPAVDEGYCRIETNTLVREFNDLQAKAGVW